MRYWTWAEIKAKVEADLDLEGEIFVDDSELLGYANEAIDEAESEIHSLYEDYFLDKSAITMVSGTSEYVLPTTIYAHKIRSVVYRNGSTCYEVKRMKDWRKMINYEQNLAANISGSSTREYNYFLTNETAGSPKILFSPAVNESGAYITVWHIRNANRLEVDADVCDIPEFVNYILQYIKVRVYEKEGHPGAGNAKAILDDFSASMVSTLATMVPDNDNEIEADYTHYDEMS